MFPHLRWKYGYKCGCRKEEWWSILAGCLSCQEVYVIKLVTNELHQQCYSGLENQVRNWNKNTSLVVIKSITWRVQNFAADPRPLLEDCPLLLLPLPPFRSFPDRVLFGLLTLLMPNFKGTIGRKYAPSGGELRCLAGREDKLGIQWATYLPSGSYVDACEKAVSIKQDLIQGDWVEQYMFKVSTCPDLIAHFKTNDTCLGILKYRSSRGSFPTPAQLKNAVKLSRIFLNSHICAPSC